MTNGPNRLKHEQINLTLVQSVVHLKQENLVTKVESSNSLSSPFKDVDRRMTESDSHDFVLHLVLPVNCG